MNKTLQPNSYQKKNKFENENLLEIDLKKKLLKLKEAY